jgi:hypothetical protein
VPTLSKPANKQAKLYRKLVGKWAVKAEVNPMRQWVEAAMLRNLPASWLLSARIAQTPFYGRIMNPFGLSLSEERP